MLLPLLPLKPPSAFFSVLDTEEAEAETRLLNSGNSPAAPAPPFWEIELRNAFSSSSGLFVVSIARSTASFRSRCPCLMVEASDSRSFPKPSASAFVVVSITRSSKNTSNCVLNQKCAVSERSILESFPNALPLVASCFVVSSITLRLVLMLSGFERRMTPIRKCPSFIELRVCDPFMVVS